MVDMKKIALFAAGTLFGSAGFKLLSSKGIVEVRQGSGTYVVTTVKGLSDPLNLRSVQDKNALAFDLVNVRLLLEPGIAEMAAQNATPEDIERLQKEYQAIVEGAIKTRDELAAMTGYNPDKGDGGSGQSGRSGSYSAMSQDQGTKLEGLFVSVQGHVINIDGWVEDVAARMSAAEGYLRDIAQNTKNSDEKLGKILELVEKMERDGINWN